MTQANQAALKLRLSTWNLARPLLYYWDWHHVAFNGNLTGDVDAKNAELQGSLDLQLPPTTNGQFEAVVKVPKPSSRKETKTACIDVLSTNKNSKAYAKFL